MIYKGKLTLMTEQFSLSLTIVLLDCQYGNGHSIQGGSSSNDTSFNRTSSSGSVVDLTNDSVLDVEEIVDLTESVS